MAESDNGNNGESAANLLTTVAKMKTRRVSLRSHKRKKSVWHRFRLRIAELAASEGLQDAVMYVICLNTLFMAADAHVNVCEDDNPDVWSFWQFRSEIFFNKAGDKSFMPVDSSVLSYKAVLEGSNLFFSIIFVMELLIKLVGFGPKKYFYSGGTSSLWNNFDLVVVILGISEFVSVFENTVCLATAQNCLAAEQCGSGNPFAVLRVFRLTRLGKLLRRFPDIYKQLAAIGKSMGAVLALMVLILLFLLIFTILGMNVFGGVMLMEFDAGEIMRGANVYVQLPWDPWNDQRPAQMPGRRGVIIDVDAEQHTNTPWKVEVWGSEGIAQELGLVSCNSVVNQAASADEVGCVWASDGGTALFNVGVITGIVPRLNFDTFFFSLITTFQVFTTANWNDDLYDVVSSSGSASSLYFYVLIVVGNWMLLNMMVAIIIQKFAEQRHQAVDAQLKEMKRHFVAHFGVLNKDQFNHELIHLFQKADADNSGVVEKLELQEMLTKDVKIVLPQNEFARLFNKYDTDKSGEIDFNEFMGLIQDVLNEAQQELEIEAGKLLPKTKTGVDTEVLFAMKAEKEEAADLTEEDQSKSLHCFAEAHPFRVVCSTITRHQWFERLILLCIVYSCVTMALDAPLLPKKHPLQPFLVTSDYVMNFIFITECVLKIVSQTLKQYLSSSWSRLDLIIVTVAIIDMILTAALSGNTAALAPLKTLRILRALRPLRLISRAEGLKVLISAMFSSVRPILGTVFIAMGVYSLLGLIGMQFLKGKMATCSDPKVKFMRDCWGLNQDGVERTWDNFPANFDVLPQAIVTMFTLATQDGWPTLMFAGMDSVGLTVQEVGSKYYNASGTGIHSEVETAFQNSSPVMFFFYWACIMVGGYIVMNMFVSVFVDGYLAAAEEMKALKEKNASDEKLKIPTTWDEPEGAVRVAISEAIIATEFDMFSALLILSNITLMAFESYKQAAWQTDLSAGSGLFFTIVFGWEALFKLYALNGARYFDSGWNKFDFFIVMISYAGLIIDNLGASVGLNPTLLRVLRIFRIFRILRAFRVFKAARGLQRIVASLAASLSSLANLGSILMLVFFIFSALATSLFGSVCVENEGGLPGLGAVRCALAGDNVVGLHSNFRHMGEAFGTLFRCSTSDAWRDILDSLAQSPADVMQPVSSLEWQRFSDLIGYDPFGLSQGDARYNAKLLSLGTARMEMAKISIRNWNASVYGMDNDPDWPTPESVPLAGEWLAMASRALPSCLSDNQVIELEGEGLMDCSYVTLDPTVYLLPTYRKGNRCQSTCAVGGDYAYLIASIFFAAFVVISNFVILQLVIAVLMDQMSNQDADPDGSHEHVPGSPDLRMHVFKRIYSRIHLNARRKLYREAFKKRQGHYPHKRQHSSKRDLEKELSDSATPPHAVASRLPSISATEA